MWGARSNRKWNIFFLFKLGTESQRSSQYCPVKVLLHCVLFIIHNNNATSEAPRGENSFAMMKTMRVFQVTTSKLDVTTSMNLKYGILKSCLILKHAKRNNKQSQALHIQVVDVWLQFCEWQWTTHDYNAKNKEWKAAVKYYKTQQGQCQSSHFMTFFCLFSLLQFQNIAFSYCHFQHYYILITQPNKNWKGLVSMSNLFIFYIKNIFNA